MSNCNEPTQSPLPLPLYARDVCVYDAGGFIVAVAAAGPGDTSAISRLEHARARAAAIAAACNGYPVMRRALQDIMHHLGAAASVATNKTAAAWLRDLAATAASALDACTNKEKP